MNQDFEKYVLSLCLEREDNFIKIIDMPYIFYGKYRLLFDIMLGLYQTNHDIDYQGIRDAIISGRSAFLLSDLDQINGGEQHRFNYYLESLIVAYYKKSLPGRINGIINKNYIDLQTLKNDLEALQNVSLEINNLIYDTPATIIPTLRDEDNGRVDRKNTVISGLPFHDDNESGFRNGELVIVGARPSRGKTAISRMMQGTNLINGYKVGVSSLEIRSKDHIKTFLNNLAKINMIQTNKYGLQDWQRERLESTYKKAFDYPYYVNNTIRDIGGICRYARMLKKTKNIDIFYVDYIQRIRVTGELLKLPRHQQIEYIGQALKDLAEDLNIPVVALAQLKREYDPDGGKRPTISDLKDSGSIEQDADVIVLLHHVGMVDVNKNKYLVNVEQITAKNRNGVTGIRSQPWDKTINQWGDSND